MPVQVHDIRCCVFSYAESVQVSCRHDDAVDITPISERRPTVDTPITLDDQRSLTSLTSLRHCSHGDDDVIGNCRLANCDKTGRDRGRNHAIVLWLPWLPLNNVKKETNFVLVHERRQAMALTERMHRTSDNLVSHNLPDKTLICQHVMHLLYCLLFSMFTNKFTRNWK